MPTKSVLILLDQGFEGSLPVLPYLDHEPDVRVAVLPVAVPGYRPLRPTGNSSLRTDRLISISSRQSTQLIQAMADSLAQYHWPES